jgi:hypothetical protein
MEEFHIVPMPFWTVELRGVENITKSSDISIGKKTFLDPNYEILMLYFL